MTIPTLGDIDFSRNVQNDAPIQKTGSHYWEWTAAIGLIAAG
jgi:hypothetical protein